MRKDIKETIKKALELGKEPDATVYSLFWTDGPDGFNGLKALRTAESNAVRVIYRKVEKDGEVTLDEQVVGGKPVRDSVFELFDALMGASQKAADDAGVDLDETGGKIDPESRTQFMEGLDEIGAEIMVDFIGTDDKFDGGGILYNYNLGRDGTVRIIGQKKGPSAKMRAAADEFYCDVLKNGDPFAFDRVYDLEVAGTKHEDPPVYSLYWTATGGPIETLLKVKRTEACVVRVEFTGKGGEITDARIAAGGTVRQATENILDSVPAVVNDGTPRGKIDSESMGLLLETLKKRGVVKMTDLLGGDDFPADGELFVFEISRAGLVGIGRVKGDAAEPFKRDLATVYKQATARLINKGKKWTPEVIKAKKGRSKK